MHAFDRRTETAGETDGHNVDDAIENAPSVEPASHQEAQREVFIGGAEMIAVQEWINPAIGFAIADAIAGWTKKPGQPNLTYHWGVVVGDCVHELSSEKSFYSTIKYVHRKIKREEFSRKWDRYHVYPVGTTRLSDESIIAHGNAVINSMPPNYNIVTNNCHDFVKNLLKLISEPTSQAEGPATTEPIIMAAEQLMRRSEVEQQLPEPAAIVSAP